MSSETNRLMKPKHGGVHTTVWTGPDGLHRLSRHGKIRCPNVGAFRTSRDHVVVGAVHVSRWTLSSMAGRRNYTSGDSYVTVVWIICGAVRYSARERVFHGPPQSIHVLHADATISFDVASEVELLEVRVPVVCGTRRVASPISAFGRVRATALTASLCSLLQGVLETSEGGRPFTAATALREVAIAVVEGARELGDDVSLRARIVDYIDQYAVDPGLGPRSIAREFGVSLRWVHQVFNINGITVCSYIRSVRVKRVAARLSDALVSLNVADLAREAGFAGREQLSRAFRAQYGMSIRDYQKGLLS